MWLSSQDEILNAVLANISFRGDDVNSGKLFGVSIFPSSNFIQLIISTHSTSASHWPPVLLLADLYFQALLTMKHDEFFGSFLLHFY